MQHRICRPKQHWRCQNCRHVRCSQSDWIQIQYRFDCILRSLCNFRDPQQHRAQVDPPVHLDIYSLLRLGHGEHLPRTRRCPFLLWCCRSRLLPSCNVPPHNLVPALRSATPYVSILCRRLPLWRLLWTPRPRHRAYERCSRPGRLEMDFHSRRPHSSSSRVHSLLPSTQQARDSKVPHQRRARVRHQPYRTPDWLRSRPRHKCRQDQLAPHQSSFL